MSTAESTMPAEEQYTCKYGQTVKLTSHNYDRWMKGIQVILSSAHALNLVLGREPRPGAPVVATTPGAETPETETPEESADTATAAPAALAPALVDEPPRTQREWIKIKETAYGILYNSITAPIQAFTQGDDLDPVKLWTILKNRFDVKD